jgi:hypothetical protein
MRAIFILFISAAILTSCDNRDPRLDKNYGKQLKQSLINLKSYSSKTVEEITTCVSEKAGQGTLEEVTKRNGKKKLNKIVSMCRDSLYALVKSIMTKDEYPQNIRYATKCLEKKVGSNLVWALYKKYKNKNTFQQAIDSCLVNLPKQPRKYYVVNKPKLGFICYCGSEKRKDTKYYKFKGESSEYHPSKVMIYKNGIKNCGKDVKMVSCMIDNANMLGSFTIYVIPNRFKKN